VTLLLAKHDVERLLTPPACMEAVEEAFRRLAHGEVPPPAILGMHGGDGSFHVKAGFLTLDRPYFAAKLNANFPQNGAKHGLPTIQGAVLLLDASNGAPLAIMDSISITALRTAAATAVAAKYLAPKECDTLLLCGCGGQAGAQLAAVLSIRKPRRIEVYDVDAAKAKALAGRIGADSTADLRGAVAKSDIVITCTTAKRFFVTRDMVKPGTFIAAVGADHEEKSEIEPALLAAAKVVTDLTEQAARIGDLHHAIEAGALSAADVYAELAEVVAGLKPGRESADEIVVFDSTGTGLQDVAAAIAAYRRALDAGAGQLFELAA
jgi:ornithine cyclodeaminase/alanine dehydrogenase-like protein (mu-crystallin family)